MAPSSYWAILSGVAGGLSIGTSAFAHAKYLRRWPNTAAMARALFGGNLNASSTSLDAAPAAGSGADVVVVHPTTRHMAFASGLMLSGFALVEQSFGPIGLASLAATGNAAGAHLYAPTLVASGVLVGVGAQMARGDLLHATFTHRIGHVATALSAAIATSCTTMHNEWIRSMVFYPESLTRFSLEASLVDDGSSMIAFGSMIMLWMAMRQRYLEVKHLASEDQRKQFLAVLLPQTMRPIVPALACGAGLGIGAGLIGLTDPNRILALLSFSGSVDPALLAGLATVAASSLFFGRYSSLSLASTSSKSASNSALVGSCLFGIGWGLSGMCPVSGMVGLSCASSSFWAFSGSMLAGTALMQTATEIRLSRRRRRQKRSDQLDSATIDAIKE